MYRDDQTATEDLLTEATCIGVLEEFIQIDEEEGIGEAREETDFGRGLACACGRNGAVDLCEAHKWFSIAAARGCREALVHRAEIAREMDAASIARAQKAARDHLRLH